MRVTPTPPAMPHAIWPRELLEWEGLGGAVGGPLPEGAADALVDVVTLEASIIAPGPYSGLSISNVGVRP